MLILLIGSITGLFKVYHHLYGAELWNRLDPIYSHKNISYKSQKFLLIGDSRIAQWEIPDSIIISTHLFNIGIDSQTSGQILQRAKDYFENYHSTYVVIQVGINDLKLIGFYPERAEYITSLTIRNIKSILELCIKQKSTPIFVNIIPPGSVELKRIPFWNNEINKSVAEVNKILMTYCESEKITVLDASKLLSEDGLRIKNEFETDCLHINEKGYKCLNIELEKIIRTYKYY